MSLHEIFTNDYKVLNDRNIKDKNNTIIHNKTHYRVSIGFCRIRFHICMDMQW